MQPAGSKDGGSVYTEADWKVQSGNPGFADRNRLSAGRSKQGLARPEGTLMSTQEYCGRHSIHYAGSSCPRCDADERHRELLNSTEASAAETLDAMRDSDYRRANPGDYACPHCKYVSLKREASRCPLCHGEVGSQYWSEVRAAENAENERRRAIAEAAANAAAAEYIRTAPQRAAAEAEALRIKQRAKNISSVMNVFGGGASGGFLGLLLGAIIGFGKGCANYSPYNGSSPFTYIPTAALTVCIIGAVLGAVVGAISAQSE